MRLEAKSSDQKRENKIMARKKNCNGARVLTYKKPFQYKNMKYSRIEYETTLNKLSTILPPKGSVEISCAGCMVSAPTVINNSNIVNICSDNLTFNSHSPAFYKITVSTTIAIHFSFSTTPARLIK